MVLISSYEFSNSFRLNYFSEDEHGTYLLNLFKVLSKLSKETVVREWQLYDIKTEDIEKYFEDADLMYKIHELKVSDLKKTLKDHNLKSTGLKNDLLSRCTENIPEEELKEYLTSVKLYKCNENAKNFLQENEYLRIYNEISSDFIAYFLSNEDYIKLFKEIPKEDITDKILIHLFDHGTNGSLGENLTFLLATLDLYNYSEDLINYLKNCIKITLIIINDFFNFDEAPGLRAVPLDDNSNNLLEFSSHDLKSLLNGFKYLINTYPNCDILETIIADSYDEISNQIPNLNKENSLYYFVSMLLERSLYELLDEEIPLNSTECIKYFNIKQKVDHKRLFINYLNDIGRYIRYGPMDYPEKYFLNKSLNEGLIKLQKPSDTLYYYNLNEIKDKLLQYDVGYFNSKNDYVKWIKENLSEEEIKENFPIDYYELSDKGNEFLEKNIHYTLFKGTFYSIFSLDLADYEPNFLSNKYLNIDSGNYEPIIPLETYENEMGDLDKLIEYINEKTLKDDLDNQMWYKYARDLGLLNNIYHINKSNEKDITKNFLRAYFIKFNGWFREDQTNLDIMVYYNLHNHRYKEEYDEFFHEIYNSMEVPCLFFSEEEIKEYMEFPYESFDVKEELKKRIYEYKNLDESALISDYLGEYWIEEFILYKEEFGFDTDLLNIFREEMCIDFEDEALKNKVNEFLIKLNDFICENKLSRDEIKQELKEYIDLINIEGEKYSEHMRNQRLDEEKLRRKIYNLNNKARTLEREGNYEEAIRLYNNSIELQEENPNLNFNNISQYSRLLIIYRKIKDYDKEQAICEKILGEYKKIVIEYGDEDFIKDSSDKEFERKYKEKVFNSLQYRLNSINSSCEWNKKESNELANYIDELKEEIKNFDKLKSEIRDKHQIQNEINILENKLSYFERDLIKLENERKELEKEMEHFDKNNVFKKDDIVLPTHVKEYKKYQKRLERIKKLKEK